MSRQKTQVQHYHNYQQQQQHGGFPSFDGVEAALPDFRQPVMAGPPSAHNQYNGYNIGAPRRASNSRGGGGSGGVMLPSGHPMGRMTTDMAFPDAPPAYGQVSGFDGPPSMASLPRVLQQALARAPYPSVDIDTLVASQAAASLASLEQESVITLGGASTATYESHFTDISTYGMNPRPRSRQVGSGKPRHRPRSRSRSRQGARPGTKRTKPRRGRAPKGGARGSVGRRSIASRGSVASTRRKQQQQRQQRTGTRGRRGGQRRRRSSAASSAVSSVVSQQRALQYHQHEQGYHHPAPQRGLASYPSFTSAADGTMQGTGGGARRHSAGYSASATPVMPWNSSGSGVPSVYTGPAAGAQPGFAGPGFERQSPHYDMRSDLVLGSRGGSPMAQNQHHRQHQHHHYQQQQQHDAAAHYTETMATSLYRRPLGKGAKRVPRGWPRKGIVKKRMKQLGHLESMIAQQARMMKQVWRYIWPALARLHCALTPIANCLSLLLLLSCATDAWRAWYQVATAKGVVVWVTTSAPQRTQYCLQEHDTHRLWQLPVTLAGTA